MCFCFSLLDKAIPKPILFYLHDTRRRTKLKTPTNAPLKAAAEYGSSKTTSKATGCYENTPTQPLPMALDLQKLHTAIIVALQKWVERLKKIEAKEREYVRIKAKRDREKQFNKKWSSTKSFICYTKKEKL